MTKDLLVTLEYKKPRLFWRILFWFLGILFLSILGLLFYLHVQSSKFIKSFSEGAGISEEEFASQSTAFLNDLQNKYQSNETLPQKFNFLILGTDKLSGREEDPELTDSILLLQLDLSLGQVKTLSLPRDLYSEDYQSKINALYFYGLERNGENPTQFPEEVIEQMTGIEVDSVVIVGIEDLEKLIEIVDGIEIDVPTAFSDPNFPIPGVDVSVVRDPSLLYEEIIFEKGPQQMDSSTALKYMRSRHSEGDEGTDIARAARQQLVLQALAQKLAQNRDPFVLGQLYRFYLDHFAQYVSLEEISTILVAYLRHVETSESTELAFIQKQLSIYPDDENGVIYNPPLWQSKNQWIYQIRDQEKFEESIDAIFN